MTAKTQHTPGPWEADLSNLVYAEDGTMIVDCSDSGSGEEDADRRAGNARLIAAAPDLLAAAQAQVQEYDRTTEMQLPDQLAIRTALRAAVEQAEGDGG